MQFYKRQTQMLWFGFTVPQAEVPLLGHGSLQLGSAWLCRAAHISKAVWGESAALLGAGAGACAAV